MGKKLQSQLPVPRQVTGQMSPLTQDQPKKTTLGEKLKVFDPVKHGGECMPFMPSGKEILGK